MGFAQSVSQSVLGLFAGAMALRRRSVCNAARRRRAERFGSRGRSVFEKIFMHSNCPLREAKVHRTG